MRTIALILPAWLALDVVLVALYAALRAHFARTYARRVAAVHAAGHFPERGLPRRPDLTGDRGVTAFPARYAPN